MYKQAAQLKLRFPTSKGLLNVEQLWDLSQTELSTYVRNTKKILKKNDDDDLAFLGDTVTDPVEELRFNILKDVFLTKKSEAEKLKNERKIKEDNQKILDLIRDKQDDNLKKKSIAQLEKLLK